MSFFVFFNAFYAGFLEINRVLKRIVIGKYRLRVNYGVNLLSRLFKAKSEVAFFNLSYGSGVLKTCADSVVSVARGS